MSDTPISDSILLYAIQCGAYPGCICSALSAGTWELLHERRPEYVRWFAWHLPLPEDVADLLYRLIGIRKRWRDGVLHHDTEPAVVRPNGYLEWRRRGLLHREDGPALVRPDGRKEWYRHGIRIDAPAA